MENNKEFHHKIPNKLEYQKLITVKSIIKDLTENTSYNELIEKVDKLYNKGFSAIDILNHIKKNYKDKYRKNKILIVFNKIRKEIKNEKMLMFFLLNFVYLRNDYNLENISFM